MTKGFVPAYNFQSGSMSMARNIDNWTRNELVHSVDGIKTKNIPINNIAAIRQALKDRATAQGIERERFARLHRH